MEEYEGRIKEVEAKMQDQFNQAKEMAGNVTSNLSTKMD